MATTATDLAGQLLYAVNAHDPDLLGSTCAPHYTGVDVGRAVPHVGPDGARSHLELYLRAFPDLQVSVNDVIAEGCRVSVVWTATGTHQGRLANIPPTDRPVCVRGTSLFIAKDGALTSGLHVWDFAGLLRALGLLPEL